MRDEGIVMNHFEKLCQLLKSAFGIIVVNLPSASIQPHNLCVYFVCFLQNVRASALSLP